MPPRKPNAKPGGGGRWLNLSVCSIFKNEAENLPDLMVGLPLSRIEWCVIDTGSTDSTIDLIRQSGVEPKRFVWTQDFSVARNASLALAKRDWILWLDGDDRLDSDFWDEVEELLDGPKQAYRFIIHSPRENGHGDRFMQIRLFPNHYGILFEGRIHEQLGTSLQKMGMTVKSTELEISHTGYETETKRTSKLVRNLALLELERIQHPHDSTVTMEYGNCLCQSKEYLKAKEIYLSLMPSSNPLACGNPPKDEILWHFPILLGETCVKLKASQEAADWYRLAVRWNPSDIQAYYWLGKQALENQNIHGALEYFYATLDHPAVVGRVATDSFTVRRNALALVVLCETELFGESKAPRARQCLRELIAGGLQSFPLDYRVPWDFLRASDANADAERYARTYLSYFPSDRAMWEDFIEFLFTTKRFGDILEIFSSKPELVLATGVLEAFRGKSLEAVKTGAERIYSVYRAALEKFPEDPTLLVYFSDFVNHNKLYERCYADLKSLPQSSEPIQNFLRQIEAQGLGKTDALGRH